MVDDIHDIHKELTPEQIRDIERWWRRKRMSSPTHPTQQHYWTGNDAAYTIFIEEEPELEALVPIAIVIYGCGDRTVAMRITDGKEFDFYRDVVQPGRFI